MDYERTGCDHRPALPGGTAGANTHLRLHHRNDVTAPTCSGRHQWTRAKGFDSFCPLGPWIETGLSVEEASQLRITTTVDGEVRQDGNTGQMIHSIPEIISYVSSFMTLLPGDVILTGTPAGVGPVRVGQRMTVAIDRIGELSNPVVARD